MRFIQLIIILLVGIILWTCSTSMSETSAAGNTIKKPNIVFIFSDDLSFRDLSIYGQTNYKTPNIDALIRNSTRFTQGYAGAPECAPSRATMLTGLHVGHSPIRLNSSARGFEPLPAESYTFAEMLQTADYETAVIGKWGMGFRDTEGNPNDQGFDYHFGYLTHYEAHSYFPWVLYENGKDTLFPENKKLDLFPLYAKKGINDKIDFSKDYDASGKLVKLDLSKAAYVPDLLDQKATEFIHRNQKKPFFLFYTANLPHGPPIVDDFRQLKDRNDMNLVSKEWGGMVQRLDKSVGALIDQLKSDGIYENTMIVFASDNGYSMHSPKTDKKGNRYWKNDEDLQNKGPFKGGKFGVWEGGMRIPFTIHLPGQTEAKIVSQPVWLVDLFPTFAAITGQQAPDDLDGYNLMPLLNEQASPIPEDRIMYFYKQNEQAIRQGPWFAFRNHPDEKVQLFLIEEDPLTTADLAHLYPKKAAELKEIFDTIHEPHPWFWNPGDSQATFSAKQKKAKATGQIIKRYRPNGLALMPWEK